jgi:hypothetical protein
MRRVFPLLVVNCLFVTHFRVTAPARADWRHLNKFMQVIERNGRTATLPADPAASPGSAIAAPRGTPIIV